ncbi:MAG TPA: hypothetical protein VFH03_25010 [Actinoplanes sp.]|nr:hypothetical protein [Actinoplanes sp.]
MNVLLLNPDHDVVPDVPLAPHHRQAGHDLRLEAMVDAMAGGDDFLADVARRVVPAGLDEVPAIRYRQDVLADCLRHPDVIRDLYALAAAAVRQESGSVLGAMAHSPSLKLQRSIDVLGMFAETLAAVRRLGANEGAPFRSAGLTRFFTTVTTRFGDGYLGSLREHLRALRFRNGVLISAGLHPSGAGTDYSLGRPPDGRRTAARTRNGIDIRIADGDDSGAQALAGIVDLGVARTAAVLARTTDRILAFFRHLRFQAGFYVGCLNLHRRLGGAPVCWPDPVSRESVELSCRGLYDVCLALAAPDRHAVGNDLDAGVGLIMITGANQGGKSTFMRAVGLAHLMMQCGMFVTAASLRATVRSGVFTHFPRDEDDTLTRGRLDDELARLSSLADTMTGGALLLLNESLSSTNEREGAQIAAEIVRALVERDVTVVYVTHMYELSHRMYLEQGNAAVFLRADRLPDGRRTYRLHPGAPLATSYGQDLYRRIFASGGAS